MLCERCNRAEADVLYRETVKGRTHVRHLCRVCADTVASAEELEDVSAALSPFSSPLLSPSPPPPLPIPATALRSASGVIAETDSSPAGMEEDVASCPLCGTTARELEASGMAGCARCYRTFRNLLGKSLRTYHGSQSHQGRISAAWRAKQAHRERLTTLREALKEAVVAECFEEATVLRDEIRRMEAEIGGM